MAGIKGDARTRIVKGHIRKRMAGKCDYCMRPMKGHEPGYVPACAVVVCFDCYENHHGRL